MFDPATLVIGAVHRFGETELTLTAVKRGASPGAFTLLLTGPPQPVLPEGLYDTSIPDGPLYIMPVHTPDRTRQDYQIVFN